MTTNVIDGALHVSSFPTTYTGPGTVIGNIKTANSVVSTMYGYFTSNGNATQINVGFTARKVRVINVTDGITWEWQYGMPAANSFKTTYGGSFAAVQDTTSQITISTDMAGIATVTLGATLNGTAKNICFEIEG